MKFVQEYLSTGEDIHNGFLREKADTETVFLGVL